MLKRVGGSHGQRFLRPSRLIALMIGLLAGWGGASAADGLEWTPAVWDAEAIYRGATVAPDLVLPEIGEAVDRLTSPRMALI